MPDTLKIVALGSGNLASHLVPALHAIGCDILQVYSRSIFNAGTLAHRVNAKAINDLQDINPSADIYLLLVKDDVLVEVCEQLPELSEEQILTHSSGASSIDILAPYACQYGSFYPLESFKKAQSKELSNVPFLIHGNSDYTIRRLRMTARHISKRVSECNDTQRLHYHLAAVFINNFTNHLACLAHEHLRSEDLEPELLDAITRTTFDKIIGLNACESQTGPAQRNDYKLMDKHLELIKKDLVLSQLYKQVSDSIIRLKKKQEDENS